MWTKPAATNSADSVLSNVDVSLIDGGSLGFIWSLSLKYVSITP